MADTSSFTQSAADSIDVALPPRAEHAATLRVLVATLGADAGFSVDEIDDLRLAVSEVFTILIDADSDEASRVHARFHVSVPTIWVTMSLGRADDPIELDALASTILSSVVDEHHVQPDGITLVKRAAEVSS